MKEIFVFGAGASYACVKVRLDGFEGYMGYS
jgi:hypothetical protein